MHRADFVDLIRGALVVAPTLKIRTPYISLP